MIRLLRQEKFRIIFFEVIGTAIFAYGYGCAGPTRSEYFISCSLFLALSLSGQITGGHFNPSLSIAAFINKKYSNVGYYLLSQLIGSTIGALWLYLLTFKSYTPIIQENCETTGAVIAFIVNQFLGTWLFTICVLTLTNKFTTHAVKSWQIYVSIPVVYYLFQIRIAGTVILNPVIGAVYQLISAVTDDWQNALYIPVLIVPSLLGGAVGGLTMKYVYEPLLLSIRFKQQLSELAANESYDRKVQDLE